MPNDVTVDLGNEYIGSAYSPQVEITETPTGHEIAITHASPDAAGQLVTDEFFVPNYSGEEADREAAEAARAAAEAQRAAAESEREAYEDARRSAESERASAESARDAAETQRASAESARSAAESARATAEQGRASAESARVAAESARAAAETARESASATAVHNAEVATAAAQSATTAAQSATSAATTATTNANAATAAANTATTNANAATSAAQAATADAQAATTAAQDAADLATTAAETVTDAYFPMLTAGAADGIKGGGPTVDAAFLHRVTGDGQASDGPATIEVVRGNTLVWNQLLRVASKTETINNVEFACDGVSKVVANGTASTTTVLAATSSVGVRAIIGHKYLLKGCPSGGVYNSTYSLVASVAATTGNATDYGSGVIFTATGDAAFNISAVVYSGYAATNVTFIPQLFDLTQMFGAGNEPSTVEEFEALFPEPYYEYDTGSLLSVNMEGIESTAADESWTQTRSIPATDLRSAGTVYDELRKNERITRVGVVDLGTLTWTETPSSVEDAYRMSSSVISGIAIPATNGTFPNLTCSKYNAVVSGTGGTWSAVTGICVNANGAIIVYDPAYNTSSSAADFKAAMSGVMLHYALATPIVTPIDPALNLSYRAEQGGTETVIVPTGEMSAPVPMVVVYGSTPDGILDRSASLLAAADGPTATANHAIGSYLTMSGQLYKVTTAIASGEAIVPGTNVTATTVMAEVLSLIQ